MGPMRRRRMLTGHFLPKTVTLRLGAPRSGLPQSFESPRTCVSTSKCVFLTGMGLCRESPLPPPTQTLMGVRRKAHGNWNVGTLHMQAARFPEKERAGRRSGPLGQTRENHGVSVHYGKKVDINLDQSLGEASEDTSPAPSAGQGTGAQRRCRENPFFSSSVTTD